jgi:carbonic anhydrase
MIGIEHLGSFDAFLVAVFFGGLFQIFLGLIRAGSIVYFVPASVIKGMLVAVGLIFMLKQLPHAIGYDAEEWGLQQFSAGGDNTFTMIGRSIRYLKWGALVLSIISISVLLLWEKYFSKFKWIPGPLIIVLLGIFVNGLYKSYFPFLSLEEQNLVFIPEFKHVQDLLSQFTFPNWDLWMTKDTILGGFTIGMIASLESLLTVEAVDKLDPEKRQTPLNRELIAQGIGNITASLIGALPITSAIVRSTASLNAGGRTKMAAVFHAIFILVSVLFIAHYLRLIPLASLASILMLIGYKLAKPSIFKEAYKKNYSYFIPFIVTCIAILFSDLLVGISIGMLVGIFFVIKSNFHSAINLTNEGQNVIISFNKDVSFLNKAKLINLLRKIPKDKRIIVDGSKAEFIDHEINEIIDDFRTTAESQNFKVEFRNLDYKMDSDQNSFYKLLDGNQKWVKEKIDQDPDYFKRLAKGQSPKFLWIGCSDSRVPSSEITNTQPGELFVHRNIANLVVHTDINLLSVVSYAVEVLKVKHVIVCGHYGCGGVKAAMGKDNYGIIDNWLRNIKDVYRLYQRELDDIEDEESRTRRLVELNVIEQVNNLSKTSIIQDAWRKGETPILHAWVYDLENGKINNLNVNIDSDELSHIYRYDLQK